MITSTTTNISVIYKLPLFEQSGKTVKKGSYTTEQLGIEGFPLIKKIHVGKCIASTLRHRYDWTKEKAVAHAHTLDTWAGHICMPNGSYIWNHQGNLHGVMYHEYGHLLAPNCNDHSAGWVQAMISLGRPDIYMPYHPYLDNKVEIKRRPIWQTLIQAMLDIDG